MYDRFQGETKFKIARGIMSELDSAHDGLTIQRRLVTEMCKLRDVPDKTVEDRDGALAALKSIKELALQYRLLQIEEDDKTAQRKREAEMRQNGIVDRARRTEDLQRRFLSLVAAKDDAQGRGYALEELLVDLFTLHEIEYRPPYRVGNSEQIDGFFRYRETDYLVESRWRQDPPSENDLVAFRRKIDKKIANTRGLFVTMTSPRAEVLRSFMIGEASKVILMDGSDLTLIMEGRISLTSALDMKIQKAAQSGEIFLPLRELV